MPTLDLSLLIPTYNEGDIIETTLAAIAAELGADPRDGLLNDLCARTEVLIMDDGQDDLIERARQAARALPFASVEVMRNPKPLGKGRSLARGFAHAAAPIVGFLDADLSTPPAYIKTAVAELAADRCDVFIASRRAEGARVERSQPLVKDLLGDALRLVINSVIFAGGTRYLDTQCGFKFFKNAVAKDLYRDLVAGDGLTDIEILVRANRRGLRVREAGVRWSDVRESKRPLGRIFWGELKSVAAILYHYKLSSSGRGKSR